MQSNTERIQMENPVLQFTEGKQMGFVLITSVKQVTKSKDETLLQHELIMLLKLYTQQFQKRKDTTRRRNPFRFHFS